MKKSLVVMLLVLSAFFVCLGVAQAGQCIYGGRSNDGTEYYYDPSLVRYSGNIVSFFLEYDDDCSSVDFAYLQIDCAAKMIRECDPDANDCEKWEPINPNSAGGSLGTRLCR
jgi:hypothetical protein